MVTTVITAMAAYSNERVAAIILSVLYRMLTFFQRFSHIIFQYCENYVWENIPHSNGCYNIRFVKEIFGLVAEPYSLCLIFNGLFGIIKCFFCI